jgi:predicted ester cyclase
MRTSESIVQAFWHDVWTLGKSELVHELFHADARENSEPMDLRAFSNAVDRLRAAFPNFAVTIEELIQISPEKIVSRVTYSGTQVLDWFGLPAKSADFKTIGIDIFNVDGGRVRELWHSTDHLDLVLQLGGKVVPVD